MLNDEEIKLISDQVAFKVINELHKSQLNKDHQKDYYSADYLYLFESDGYINIKGSLIILLLLIPVKENYYKLNDLIQLLPEQSLKTTPRMITSLLVYLGLLNQEFYSKELEAPVYKYNKIRYGNNRNLYLQIPLLREYQDLFKNENIILDILKYKNYLQERMETDVLTFVQIPNLMIDTQNFNHLTFYEFCTFFTDKELHLLHNAVLGEDNARLNQPTETGS